MSEASSSASQATAFAGVNPSDPCASVRVVKALAVDAGDFSAAPLSRASASTWRSASLSATVAVERERMVLGGADEDVAPAPELEKVPVSPGRMWSLSSDRSGKAAEGRGLSSGGARKGTSMESAMTTCSLTSEFLVRLYKAKAIMSNCAAIGRGTLDAPERREERKEDRCARGEVCTPIQSALSENDVESLECGQVGARVLAVPSWCSAARTSESGEKASEPTEDRPGMRGDEGRLREQGEVGAVA